MSKYDKGETIVFEVEIRNQSTDVLFDPSSISITIRSSKQEVKVSEQPMTKSSVGLYYYEWISDQSGMYKVIYKAMDGSKITYENDQFNII